VSVAHEGIRSALEAGDLETARSLGHQMKGSGGGYGFDRLTEIGLAIETAAGDGDAGTVSVQVDELAGYLDRLVITYEDLEDE
jgi:HPt (histidine-containing phosphotransfer) domain-containing protein